MKADGDHRFAFLVSVVILVLSSERETAARRKDWRMAISRDPDSIRRFICKIQELPSDEPVADRRPEYNNYNTQKDHWLGWLGISPGRGTHTRKTVENVMRNMSTITLLSRRCCSGSLRLRAWSLL
jgi:hypothetical protein